MLKWLPAGALRNWRAHPTEQRSRSQSRTPGKPRRQAKSQTPPRPAQRAKNARVEIGVEISLLKRKIV